ncbi:DUF6491 family protein [Hyphococcus luteus]|uniref:Uncharacterized protein n=1 Tax=Hyphococcus luteus TaxID=2058213 RepID=A0A2S7K164_9PROT|nr:DUF6491 family protein [Marinicaulis flavus]PQA86178.1 hypothetical protein CW354_17630 [Marinicaulis flavus]
MKKILMSGAVLSLAACQAYPDKTDDSLQAEIAQKQGEEVSRICFARTINSWRPLGDDAVLIEQGVNDWYQLSLSGACKPEWAFDAIALKTRGSSCITKGDKISTPDSITGGPCFITDMHEWNEPRR